MDLFPVNIFIAGLNGGTESEHVKCKEDTRLRGYRSALEDRIRKTNEYGMLGKKVSSMMALRL